MTHRGLASSFHVITGHEDGNKTSSALDYQTLAKEEGTLVFLMGLKNLDKIAANLIANGKIRRLRQRCWSGEPQRPKEV